MKMRMNPQLCKCEVKAITTFFDMFAGIGGFRSGLEAVDGYRCIGHCEIDKHANQAYNAMYDPKGELYFEDAGVIIMKGKAHIVFKGRIDNEY